MRLLLIGAVIIALFLTSLLIYGTTLSAQVEIEHSVLVEAPDAVVWSAITTFPDHNKWQQDIDALYNFNYSARQVRYHFNDKTILVNQQVRVLESKKLVDFIQIGDDSYSEIDDLGGELRLLVLEDGNSEVYCKIKYTLSNPTEKLLNKFYIVPQFERLIANNLNALKKYIEQ